MSHTPVDLVRFDADEERDVFELRRQRVLCGWGIENVELWRSQVRDGVKGLYWIFSLEPQALSPLLPALDEAAPAPDPAFIPLGHVSLDWDDYDGDETLASREERKCTLATFYILPHAQGKGVGRATMDAVESLARSPQFGAQFMTLNTMPASDMLDPTWCATYGQPFLPEKQIMQRWYERLGFSVYGTRDRPWWTDPATGAKVGMPCVNMIKAL